MMKKLLPLAIVLLLVIVSIRLSSPPDVIAESAADSIFSAQRAFHFLQEISKAPHSVGTSENKRVREYIAATCRQYGLDVRIQQTTSVQKNRSYILAANVYNVVATLKGKKEGKSLLVMSHYDTQPNTPGAGDDGAGVAAMLETIRMLSATKERFNNDVIFLFTDAEETGLSGAQGFAQDTVLLSKIGFVLNYEGRGNSGVSSLFELNSENGWAANQYMNVVPYPVGNSLGYEIYKNLPNDTDYTIFRKSGISGLNNAFIDGFVNYHSPNDTPEHLDLRSLQHHGSNLLSLVKHLGNSDLTTTKAPDITFFNVIGYWMVSYPASWNLAFTILTSLLFVLWVALEFRSGRISWKGFAGGFFIFVGVLISLSLITFFLIKGILAVYPMYNRFYAANSYNSSAYFLAFVALAIFIFTVFYQWLIRKIQPLSLLAGVLLCQIILLNLFYSAMPTAIFILLFPILFFVLGRIILVLKSTWEDEDWKAIPITLVSLLPAVLWLPQIIDQTFIVFGLSAITSGVVFVVGLLLGLLLPILNLAFHANRYLISGAAVLCFIIALVMGHLTSGFDESHPLQSNVYYQLDADNNKSYWMSRNNTTDEWNQQYLQKAKLENGRLMNEAPLLPLAMPTAVVVSDTVVNNVRKLRLHCAAGRQAESMIFEIDEKNPVHDATLIGPAGDVPQSKKQSGPFNYIDYQGLDSLGFDVIFETLPDKSIEFALTSRSHGMPLMPRYKERPKWIVPAVGQHSNTTQVIKTFVF